MTLLRMLSFNTSPAEARSAGSTVTPVTAPRTPARQAAPAPAPAAVAAAKAPAPAASVSNFDGNWPALVERLKLTGMAGMAAKYAELASFDNNHLELVVPEDAPHVRGEAVHREAEGGAGAALRREPALTCASAPRRTSVAAAKSREMAQKQASARRGDRGRSFRARPGARPRRGGRASSIRRRRGAAVHERKEVSA
jgi:DNA polymerase-3 subunit gamma/tau